MSRLRRPWTEEEIEKLRSMAQKYPPTRIAEELGRKVSSIQSKARGLGISLRRDRPQGQAIDSVASAKT
jgi:hypothetical protein